MAAPPPPSFGLRNTRQAVLVIHGIGEQNPYETLDSFARGLFNHLSRRPGASAHLSPLEIAHTDWTQVGMRIGLFGGHGPAASPAQRADVQPDAYVDVFEYYWAPETKDKLSDVETLKWVLRTDFTPLRYFADNLQEMISAERLSYWRAFRRAVKLYFRELARVALFYVPFGAGLGALLWWLSQEHKWGDALKKFDVIGSYFAWDHGIGLLHGGILFVYLLAFLMAWFGAQSLRELLRCRGPSIEAAGETTWFVLDILALIFFLGIAVTADLRTQSYAFWRVLRTVFGQGRWEPLAGAAIAAVASYALTAYVADVAVYTTMDAKSKNFAARNAILKGSTTALKQLLASDAYDRVILAGHSLGSVIAYDSINELLAEINATPGPAGDHPDPSLTDQELIKLKGLCTFGSPLDKISYFFREHVKRDQAVRAQILSMLHSFRKCPSGRNYGEFDFSYRFGQLDGSDPLVWINAWARMDTVSAELRFYLPDDQRQFHYCAPVVAHLRYWSDPAFYDYFGSSLL